MRTIRLACHEDLKCILTIYQEARSFMRRTGNMHQWVGGYPSGELLESDIDRKQLYVVTEDDILHGVFAFIQGADPTYAYIENGAWRSDGPYGTIHRIASDGLTHGVFTDVLRFCRERQPHVRIDTHADNLVMQHVVVKHGFHYCGVIYLENGDPRLAYELPENE